MTYRIQKRDNIVVRQEWYDGVHTKLSSLGLRVPSIAAEDFSVTPGYLAQRIAMKIKGTLKRWSRRLRGWKP